MVSAKISSGRILDPGGPIVIRGKSGEGEDGRGIALLANACDHIECKTVFLDGYVIDDRCKSVTYAAGKLSFEIEHDPGRDDQGLSGERISAHFNVETGSITMEKEASEKLGNEEPMRLLREVLDEPHQEILRRRWRLAKGLREQGAWKELDWSWWQFGNLLPHNEVYPDERDLMVTVDGKYYVAQDYYCINPGCDCHDVTLAILDPSNEKNETLGRITVDYESWKVDEIEPETGSKTRLQKIWRALSNQMRHSGEFRDRHQKLQEFSPEFIRYVNESSGEGVRPDTSGNGRVSNPLPVKEVTLDELLERLIFIERPFPREVLEEAITRREEITPCLLGVLEDTIDRAEELGADPDYFAHIYAFFLLGQFRERQAHELCGRFASLPEKTLEDLGCEFLSADFPRILAATAHGDLTLPLALIRDSSVCISARTASIDSIPVMVIAGDLDRQEAIEILRELFNLIIQERREGKKESELYRIGSALIWAACDLYPEELMSEIKTLYELDLVDEFCINREDVNDMLVSGKEGVLENLHKNPQYSLISDTVKELKAWACFNEKDADRDLDDSLASGHDRGAPILSDPGDRRPREESIMTPITNTVPKVGRNDPCPCGSGKKYKKCCLNK